jgi:beta-1,2-mannobiose phosphorylase / 1,2-beta-oligomannan phosphorylase
MMQFAMRGRISAAVLLAAVGALFSSAPTTGAGTSAGWRKYESNPVIGGKLGTVFDVTVLKEGNKYRMWASWRPKKSIALFESSNGTHWGEPTIVLGPTNSGWEDDVNRPGIVKRPDGYHLWYTGQAHGHSWIGYAVSRDGRNWERVGKSPVLSADAPWEKMAVMCPQVIWDGAREEYRMWYSGGEQYEPDAIGYATSKDGAHWTKYAANPIFQADAHKLWERDKVTAAQVVEHAGWFYMFYIGFRDIDHAQIGIARSRDGVGSWDRLARNPIISPDENAWDADACYKPWVIFDHGRWLLWYNGRRGALEQIGLAIHDGEDLGFGKEARVSGSSVAAARTAPLRSLTPAVFCPMCSSSMPKTITGFQP